MGSCLTFLAQALRQARIIVYLGGYASPEALLQHCDKLVKGNATIAPRSRKPVACWPGLPVPFLATSGNARPAPALDLPTHPAFDYTPTYTLHSQVHRVHTSGDQDATCAAVLLCLDPHPHCNRSMCSHCIAPQVEASSHLQRTEYRSGAMGRTARSGGRCRHIEMAICSPECEHLGLPNTQTRVYWYVLENPSILLYQG